MPCMLQLILGPYIKQHICLEIISLKHNHNLFSSHYWVLLLLAWAFNNTIPNQIAISFFPVKYTIISFLHLICGLMSIKELWFQKKNKLSSITIFINLFLFYWTFFLSSFVIWNRDWCYPIDFYMQSTTEPMMLIDQYE